MTKNNELEIHYIYTFLGLIGSFPKIMGPTPDRHCKVQVQTKYTLCNGLSANLPLERFRNASLFKLLCV